MFRGLTQAVTLVRSGIIDREYYQALTGEQFRSPLAVARHFLSSPERADLSVHPLFEPRFLQRTPDPDLVLHYLEHPGQFRKQSPHPVFDLAAAKNALRSACVQYPEGAWLAWVRTAKADTPVPVAAQSRPVLWGDLRDSLIRAAAQWREPDPDRDPTDLRQAAATDRRASLTSIVVPIAGDLAAALARLQLLKTTEASELICTGFTSRAQLSCFTALSRTRPVVVVRAADTDLARQWNLGAAASSGERLVFVAPNAVLKSTAIDHLVAALSDTRTVIVQPLNETPAMTVHSAGAYFSPGEVVPSPLLHDHPTVDAEGLGTTAVPAAYSVVTAIRSQDFFDLGGFEERYGNNYVEVDLSLRAAGSGMGDVTLVPDARATLRPLRSAGSRNDTVASAELLRAQHHAPSAGGDDLLGTAGFRVAEYLEQKLITADPDAGSATVHIPRLTRMTSGLDALPRLRWTIDTAVTAGWWAQVWGDWHFANSLAQALRRLGQNVAVDTKQARGRETRRFDDVLLTLRGLDPVPPASGQVSLMWVISHPDDVTARESAGYDRVFAASALWAAERSTEWGIEVEPLLQCTDPEFFHSKRGQQPPNDRALFVGNIRPDRTRPMVDAAAAAGIGLDLYGTGWEDTAFAAQVVSKKVANADLGRLYAEAGVVLNDHWPDMRRLGFLSNRLFDAVACGARVLSDSIPGADGLFDGSVRFCETSAAAEELLRKPLDEGWASLDERQMVAERIRKEHSFDQRARVLLDHAISTFGG